MCEIVKYCKFFIDSKFYWRIDDFWNKFEDVKYKINVELYSFFFYISFYGYKFKIVVFLYGNGSGEGLYFLFYVCFFLGEYDMFLKWLFEGEIILLFLD